MLATALCTAAVGTVSAENWVAYYSNRPADGLAVLQLYETESLEYSAEDKVHSVWLASVPHQELANIPRFDLASGVDVILSGQSFDAANSRYAQLT